MALRMSSAAAEASAISPLRTPRERACPMPIRLRAPAALISPTTAHTLDVPTSRPTMIEPGSNMFTFGCFGRVGRSRGHEAGFEPASWDVVLNRKIYPGEMPASLATVIDNDVPATHLS